MEKTYLNRQESYLLISFLTVVVIPILYILLFLDNNTLTRWQEGYTSSFFFQIHPFITITALYGIYLSKRNRDLRFLIAACFVGFVFPLIISLFYLGTQQAALLS